MYNLSPVEEADYVDQVCSFSSEFRYMQDINYSTFIKNVLEQCETKQTSYVYAQMDSDS